MIQYNRDGITQDQNYNPTVEMIKLILIKVIYLTVIFGLPLYFTDYAFWQVLLGFIALHVTAGVIMSTVFQMAHVVEGTDQPLADGNHQIQHEWMIHQFNTTSDFGRKNGLLSWYIGGLDFQIEQKCGLAHILRKRIHIH